MSRVSLLLYTLAYLLVAIGVSWLMHTRVPGAYMDEEFHVPQTQTYCAGHWKQWNGKITTFPGLYLTAVPYAQLVQRIGQATGLFETTTAAVTASSSASTAATASAADLESAAEALCSVTVLRSLNILYGVLCIPLLWSLLRALHPLYFSARPGRLLLATMQASLFPLSFFFLFLFYTDGASVFWTLAAYLAHLRGWRFLGATLGVASVAMRQTNIVWVGFMLLTDLVNAWTQGNDEELFGALHAREAQAATAIAIDGAVAVGGEKENKIAMAAVPKFHPTSWFAVPGCLVRFVFACVRALPEIVFRHVGPLLSCVAFVLFVVCNDGSIVVGDKAHHRMSIHVPQMMYFVAFSAGMTVPNWIGVDAARQSLGMVARNKVLATIIAAAMTVGVHFFTLAHPFLLSDNRHYVFYVWKNLFRRWDLFRYAAVPFYLLCGGVLQRSWSSRESRNKLWQACYWLVVSLCLIPTPLLEPRYFLTPFLVWFLHSAPALVWCGPRATIAVLFYALINAATLAVFIFKPFTWNDGSEARFMW